MFVEKRVRYTIDDGTDLRLLEDDNGEELFALTEENREHLRVWLPWVENVHCVADARRYIRSCVQQFAEDNGFQTGIWYGKRLVGVIGFHSVDWTNRSTALGYWIGESFQGRGIVTRACRLLVDLAFREWRLNRVEIRCATKNYRSRAIPQRLGFTEEGIVREAEWLNDRFVDLVIYGIIAGDWMRLQRQRTGEKIRVRR